MADSKQAGADKSIISRWSRRKLEAKQAPVASQPANDEAIAIAPDGAPANEISAEKPLTDADMPDIDSLTETSDFSAFMSSGVSDELRNLALRKLFHAPIFNIRDGLDEYDEDYTSFEKLGDIITCDMKHQIEMQEKKLREALERENEAIEDEDVEAIEAEDTEVIDAEHVADDAEDSGQQEATAALDADDSARKSGTDHE